MSGDRSSHPLHLPLSLPIPIQKGSDGWPSRSRWDSGSGSWSIFHLLTPIQEKRGTRPYLPTVVLAVDRDTGLILSIKALGPGPPVTERQGLLVELLETADMLPSEIVVDTATTARLVEPITNLAGVRLSTGTTPALDEAKDELMAFMG